MPQIIRTIDEIMSQKKQGGFFVNFGALLFLSDKATVCKVKSAHLEWFERHELNIEAAASRGWLSGHPVCYAVNFENCGYPQIVEYITCFEDHSGRSLDPGSYQMCEFIYED